MELPEARDYLAGSSLEKQALQAAIAGSWLAALSDASTYAELYRRVRVCVDAMRHRGFDVTLLDEDGETMVAHGVRLSATVGGTITATWDPEEGVSISCAFSNDGATRTLVGHGATLREWQPSNGVKRSSDD